MKWPQRKIHQSSSTNIFHLCVHKTASQWIRKILSDRRTFRYSGLRPYAYFENLPGGYDPRKITERSFDRAFPENTIISPLYIDYLNYDNIPKPPSARGFFVQRDPRDILVSYYYSMRNSHSKMGGVEERRRILRESTLEDGIRYTLTLIVETGLLEALYSWGEVGGRDPDIMVVRYEDLIGAQQFEYFSKLFSHLDILMPEKILKRLLDDYSFKRLSGGRETGDEDTESHYRKGVEGEWKKLLSLELIAEIRKTTGNLVESLGYSW